MLLTLNAFDRLPDDLFRMAGSVSGSSIDPVNFQVESTVDRRD